MRGKKPKKTTPVRQTQMLLVTDAEGAVLLQRRPPTGIWGGLLSLPEIPQEADVTQWCKKHLGCIIEEEARWPLLRHTFSHFHLDITPVRARLVSSGNAVRDDDEWGWHQHGQLCAGLPAPVSRLLQQLEQENNFMLEMT